MVEIREHAFESAIEAALLAEGPDDPMRKSIGGEKPPSIYDSGHFPSGGWHKRDPEEYDRKRCLIPRDVFDFIYATQPKEWKRLQEHHGAEVKEQFLIRLARQIEQRGALDVLRKGIKDSGCHFRLAFFQPSSGLNVDLQKLHGANLFAIIRQLHFSEKTEQSIDMGLFLNGIPIFTAELKNPLNGQTVEDAIRQYCFDRDPREPLFTFRRCLGHFAVDPDLIYLTTQLQGTKTRFLPFNRGRFGGAGNTPRSPVEGGYPTDYLWNEVWARDSVLNLIQHFIQEIEIEDDKGRKTGELDLIFPRYHQLDAVRRLVSHAGRHGTGQRYLIQHSAGSGKSNSIAWLAHQLSILHDPHEKRVFDSIVVITDRRILDRQLQRTVRQFEQTDGVVENIEKTSRQLKEALESGKTIIVSTLQKYPVIATQIGDLAGKQFAVIVDEAHSSQSGESVKGLKSVLAAGSLEEAEKEDAAEKDEEDELNERIELEMKRRGRLANVSYFAFTATPKPKTLELFGARLPDGKFEAFSTYTMRQAIEERFILDVLENYTTYKAFWNLHKKVENDPHYEKDKANYLLKEYVDLHEHAIQKKIEIMVGHFHQQVASKIKGKAKAMIVTRSRLHAVRYILALRDYLKKQGYPYQALVAFSGTVRDGGVNYTEAGMNGFPERQTAETFKRAEYRFLVAASKFQTGFDQPLLHTMYVDKKLGGVNAVQTLSRLNRIYPDKRETMVLDFANEAEDIRKAFEPYYERTILSEATDPNLLYDYEHRLMEFRVYTTADIEMFGRVYFGRDSTMDKLYAVLTPSVDRFKALAKDEQAEFRGQLYDFIRLYAFLSQILTFVDTSLEKHYAFARCLARYLPMDLATLPREIQQKIDMESFRLQRTYGGKIVLERGQSEVSPIETKSGRLSPDEIEALSIIIRELNERFGTDFTEQDKVFIRDLEERLAKDPALRASVKVNPPENARLTFDHVVTDRLQDMMDTNFKFYKRVTDDHEFAKYFLDWLFQRFRHGVDDSTTKK